MKATPEPKAGEKRVASMFQVRLRYSSTKGPFTNYVYKRRGVGGQKNRLFVNFYTIEDVNGGGAGGQKKPNFVGVRSVIGWGAVGHWVGFRSVIGRCFGRSLV